MRTTFSLGIASTIFLAVVPMIANAQTKVLPAADISAAQIQAQLGPQPPNALPNIRVVDAGGYNVGIGALNRKNGQTRNAAVHYKVSEVYHIMKGEATLVTGGTMVNGKPRPADSMQVLHEDGPGATGTGIEGGTSRQIKEGDVVVIPAGTPHWFSKIPESITYIVIRIDPSQVVAVQ